MGALTIDEVHEAGALTIDDVKECALLAAKFSLMSLLLRNYPRHSTPLSRSRFPPSFRRARPSPCLCRLMLPSSAALLSKLVISTLTYPLCPASPSFRTSSKLPSKHLINRLGLELGGKVTIDITKTIVVTA